MLVLVLSLIILGLFAALIGYVSNRHGDEEDNIVSDDSCATCSGSNPKCEQECMMEAATKEIEYYNDEELDQYKGRSSDSYDENEVEEFSEVLYTLKPEDIKGWNRSLILRGINIPDTLKDELVMMME